MTNNDYLMQILQKYKAKSLYFYSPEISDLKTILKNWAHTCFLTILESGSCAKGTAIHLASDVDYLISLKNSCNGGLKGIYNSLYSELQSHYSKVRKQNVSVRVTLDGGLEVDVTPGRKYSGNTNYHSLYVSKEDTWQQTNIQKHISDVSQSGRTDEIKLLKIWRELNGLDFPSIYMEYLVIDNILYGKSKDSSNLASNFFDVLSKLSQDNANPLFSKIIDPANSNNTLSDLLSISEKYRIINQAKTATSKQSWAEIVW